jgi:metal-responsive CopG/Arc/MetJ family transcriptional regulator
MKAKVSLTLSQDLLQELDQMAGRTDSRSSFIEKILRNFVAQRAQRRRLAREVAAINEHAAKLNAEMNDALSFQTAVD